MTAGSAPTRGETPDEFAVKLARRFHEVYENLAPAFDYETRSESAVPWEDVPENNRRLMIAVCCVIADEFFGAA